jgi:hypothetical protein
MSASSLVLSNRPEQAWIGRIMTALEDFPTLPRTQSGVPVASHLPSPPRLRLRVKDHRGFVDGGWWPRSTDLTVELPSLISTMLSAGFDVARIVYSVTAWDDAPKKMLVAGRPVRFGGYRRPDTSTICLADSSGRKSIMLAVIPPQTERAVAEFALEVAGLDGDRQRADEILTCAASGASRPLVVTSGDRLPWARWETDGGRVLAS